MPFDVTLIPGDGIGPEITDAAVKVLEATGIAFNWDRQTGGMAAVESAGTPLPDATVASIRRTGLALKGPLTTPIGGGFRSLAAFHRNLTQHALHGARRRYGAVSLDG